MSVARNQLKNFSVGVVRKISWELQICWALMRMMMMMKITVVLTWTGVSGLGIAALVSPKLLWLQVLMYILGLPCNNSMWVGTCAMTWGLNLTSECWTKVCDEGELSLSQRTWKKNFPVLDSTDCKYSSGVLRRASELNSSGHSKLAKNCANSYSWVCRAL